MQSCESGCYLNHYLQKKRNIIESNLVAIKGEDDKDEDVCMMVKFMKRSLKVSSNALTVVEDV